MCSECHSTPCLNGCPNKEDIVVCRCLHCDGEIYEGELYYDFSDYYEGMKIHYDCIKEFLKEAERS